MDLLSQVKLTAKQIEALIAVIDGFADDADENALRQARAALNAALRQI